MWALRVVLVRGGNHKNVRMMHDGSGPTIPCGDAQQFLEAVLTRGLGTIIVAHQREYAQDVDQPGVVYERMQKSVLLAYDPATGAVIRCPLAGADADPEPLQNLFLAKGLRVELRSRNLT